MFLALNIVLHVFILYSFLSLFFVLYISKTEKKAFQDEFQNVVQQNLTQALANADQQLHGQVKIFLQGAQPVLTVMANMYANPSPDVATYNRWLFITMAMIATALIVSFSLAVGVLKYSCQTCLPVWHLIKENLVVFAVIGVAEFLFFTKVASTFVPVPPSLLITSLIDRLKSNLSK